MVRIQTMNRYFLTFKEKGIWHIQYVIITSENESDARAVFGLIYHKEVLEVTQNEPKGLQYQHYQSIVQRQTEN